MVNQMTAAHRQTLVRVAKHPAVWSLPVMALLVVLVMPANNGFYEFNVNYDPQGDGQQLEWVTTRWIFRYTSGVLCGQFLCGVVGVLLARRHRHLPALAIAVLAGVALAAITVAVAIPLAGTFPVGRLQPAPLSDPVLIRVLRFELAAYPLCAAAGVGLGVLIRPLSRGRRRWLAALGAGWWVAAIVGLLQDDALDVPQWTLGIPPLAAGAALALAGLSMDVWEFPAVLVGDWGREASNALLIGLAVWAVILNLAGFARRFWR